MSRPAATRRHLRALLDGSAPGARATHLADLEAALGRDLHVAPGVGGDEHAELAADRSPGGAGVVELVDLLPGQALLGRAQRAVLRHAVAVAEAVAGDGDRAAAGDGPGLDLLARLGPRQLGADAGRAGSSSALAASAIGSRRERVIMWSLPRERTTNLRGYRRSGRSGQGPPDQHEARTAGPGPGLSHPPVTLDGCPRETACGSSPAGWTASSWATRSSAPTSARPRSPRATCRAARSSGTTPTASTC